MPPPPFSARPRTFLALIGWGGKGGGGSFVIRVRVREAKGEGEVNRGGADGSKRKFNVFFSFPSQTQATLVTGWGTLDAHSKSDSQPTSQFPLHRPCRTALFAFGSAALFRFKLGLQ